MQRQRKAFLIGAPGQRKTLLFATVRGVLENAAVGLELQRIAVLLRLRVEHIADDNQVRSLLRIGIGLRQYPLRRGPEIGFLFVEAVAAGKIGLGLYCPGQYAYGKKE